MSQKGKTIRLSRTRTLIIDFLHFAKKVPTVPVQRAMDISELVRARRRVQRPPGWCAIFTKAFAMMAQRVPEFRQAYLSFPWGRLYEHPSSIATVAVERDFEGQKAVFFGHLHQPENQPLKDLERHLQNYQKQPVECIGLFRRALRISSLPRFLRRLAWWSSLEVSGAKRAKRMGTFGVSVYSSLGAESLHPIGPLTSTMTYGIIGTDGRVPVRFIYDHRVMDGATVARAMAVMEDILTNEILKELLQSAGSNYAIDSHKLLAG